MVFSSLFFVFFFLVLNIISQIVLRNPRHKNIAMLIFSLVFYAWGGPRYLLLLMGMAAICWVGALRIEQTRTKNGHKAAMIITVAACLAILGIFKYTGFFLTTFKKFTGLPEIIPQIALPIGISFYTFQLISYVVDVYRRDTEAQHKYWMLLLYASLFHQCIAGPIVRYKDIASDLEKRTTKTEEISRGVSRFAIGLAKKALLANGCATLADTLLTGTAAEMATVPATGVMLSSLAYMLEIYLDFSAYSDMAIGMGLMCGLHYRENFNYPYISRSVTEFWRRWHISLSMFFRDYVYIPLGGSRCSLGRQIFNLLVIWSLTGLWHGASWNFVIWGLGYGVLLMIERYIIGRDRWNKVPAAISRPVVLLIVYVGWIIFRFTDRASLEVVLKGLFCMNGNAFYSTSVGITFKNYIFFLIFCCVACTPFGVKLMEKIRGAVSGKERLRSVLAVWDVIYPTLLLVLSAMALAGDSYNPFLYFRF
ncbi:MAG: MBOAT family O-acyltransferase [Bilifractor sp.]